MKAVIYNPYLPPDEFIPQVEKARNQIANIHGGMFEAMGQWYICYHRHTNGTQFSRQGCIEPVKINLDGSIDQVECTSFGLSGGCINARRTIPGWRACNLYKGQGGTFIKFGPRNVAAPYVILEEAAGEIQSYCTLSEGFARERLLLVEQF